jgi:hypothetical protein
MKNWTLLAACGVAFMVAAVLSPGVAAADCLFYATATRTFDGGVQPATLVNVGKGAVIELEDTTKLRVDVGNAASPPDAGARSKLLDFTATPEARLLRLRYENDRISIVAADGGAYDTTVRGCSP